ncbi:MAG: type II toxin-antitoxin system VapC family toxin [Bacteroidota bacterium]
MNYLLDTNIFIAYCRKGATSRKIESDFLNSKSSNTLFVSVVTLGELDSFVKRNGIGQRKRNLINELLEKCYVVDINIQEIIDKYGDIDAFSQAKIKIPNHEFTARNMGKNDLWIAAITSHFNLTLLTTDKDFSHLHQAYLPVAYVQPA